MNTPVRIEKEKVAQMFGECMFVNEPFVNEPITVEVKRDQEVREWTVRARKKLNVNLLADVDAVFSDSVGPGLS